MLGYLRDDLTLALNLARAARNPSLEELYNLGPHAGNFAFEIGDPTLPTEVAYGADLSLRYRGAALLGRSDGLRQQHRRLHLPVPDRRDGGRTCRS